MAVKINGSINVNLPQVDQQNQPQQTSYQQNVAQPVQEPYTTRRAMAQMMNITNTDPQKGYQLQQQFNTLQHTRGSMYYNPFTQATNPAVAILQSYGIDTTQEGWYENNTHLQEYFKTTGNNNNAKSPGKKASDIEKLAYAYAKYGDAIDTTNKAKTESAALREELNFLANWSDRNYSDDQIISMVDWSKYPTLQKMKDSAKNGEPIVLNEAVDMASDDWMYGVLWAARNDGGSGNIWKDMAYSYDAVGNQWQDNEDTAARLDWNNKDRYAPYTVSSTADDVCKYYGVTSFDRDWLDQHLPSGNDKTEIDMWNKAYDAVEFTEQAQAELLKANDWLDKKLQNVKSKEEADGIMRLFDQKLNKEWKHLKQMDDSTKKYGKLIGTSNKIDYSRNDVLRRVNETCAEKGTMPSSVDSTVDAVTGVAPIAKAPNIDVAKGNLSALASGVDSENGDRYSIASSGMSDNGMKIPSEKEREVISAQDANLRNASLIVDEDLDDSESAQIANAGTVAWGDMTGMWSGAMNGISAEGYKIPKETAQAQAKKADMAYTETALAYSQTIYDYEDIQKNSIYWTAAYNDLYEKYGSLENVGKKVYDNPSVQMTLNGIPVDIHLTKGSDGKYQFSSVTYPDDSGGEAMASYDEAKAMFGGDSFDSTLARTIDMMNQHASDVEAANSEGIELSEEDQAHLQELYTARAYKEKYEQELYAKQGEYEEAVKAERKARSDYFRSYYILQQLGAETDGGTQHLQMINYMMDYGAKQPKEKHSYSDVNILDEQLRGMVYTDANGKPVVPQEAVDSVNASLQETKEQIADLQYLLDYFGDTIPDNYRNNVTAKIASLEWSAKEYESFLYQTNDDFDEMVKLGKERSHSLETMVEQSPEMHDLWDMLTKEEKERYYYLYGRDGAEAAEEYFDHVHENLGKRKTEDYQAAVRNTINEGILSGIGLNVLSIASAPGAAIMNAMGLINKAITGEDVSDSSFSWLNTIANTTQEETAKSIRDHFTNENGDVSALGQIVGGLYEIAWNRGRSAMNALAFPGLGALNEFVAAAPMAATAMFDTIVKAEEAGAEDWQAWTLGAVTFLCEAGTEMIEIGHIKEAKEMGLNTLTGIKEFLKTYPIRGISELTGESLNDIIEKAADRIVMRDESEYEQRVWEYMTTKGLSREDAEALATKDDIYDVMHTALISFFSPAMDIASFASGKIQLYNHYRQQANQYDMSIRDIRNNAQINARYEQEVQGKDMVQGTPQIEVDEEGYNKMKEQEKEYLTEMEILETAKTIDDTSSKSSAISAVLNDGNSVESSDMADAAAVLADKIFGNVVETIQDIMQGGLVSELDINAVKAGIRYAVLGGENSASQQIAMSEEFANAAPDKKAEMLANSAAADEGNADVQATVSKAVRQNRIAVKVKLLMAGGELEKSVGASNDSYNAMAATQEAEQQLDTKQAEEEAAAQANINAINELVQNPGNDDLVKQALHTPEELKNSDTSSLQYEQQLANAQKAEEEADKALNDAKQKELAVTRQKAIDMVDAEDQQRAQAKAEQAEQERIAFEQAEAERAKAKAEEDERTGKAQEDRDMALIDQKVENLGLKGEQAENVRQQLKTFYQDMKTGKIDTSKMLTDAEAMIAIGAMSRRLGVQIEIGELPEGKDGRYANGKITLSNKLTVGQAMLEVALHEIPHSMEKTKSYGKYKSVVMDILFKNRQELNAAINEKIKFYKDHGVELSREGAEAEIVADFSKNTDTFANRETINRFLDAGIGGKLRNTLHNINQFLKNVKLEGQARVDAENLRKAERLFTKMIDERRAISSHPSNEQFSVNQFAEAAGLFYNEIEVRDKDGNIIAKPGLYTADPQQLVDGKYEGPPIERIEEVTPEMMENTPVGMLTNAAQALGTMSKETVGKIHKMFADLMTMCTNLQDTNLVWEIAGSTLYSEFSAIKSNSDKQYSNTVDFGTICTKTQAVINQLSRDMLRLGRGLTSTEILDVYNDVFNSDLTVPCPVCYVFSRWLGVPSLLENIRQYQNRFLGEEGKELTREETQKLVDEFIANAHEEYGIDKNFDDNLAKARERAQGKQNTLNAKIAQEQAKIANYEDKLALKPERKDWKRNKAKAEERLANLQKDLDQAKADYENADVAAYTKAINKKKADLEKSIKDKLVKIEGDDKGTRGINDDIRDAIKEGKPYNKLEEKRTAIYKEIDALNAKLREVDAYNWVTQALCKMDMDGRFVLDDDFVRTKNEVLLDLNRTGEFAKDVKNWTYRCTRGAGMGKTILPYSGASIGDSVLGTAARTMANPYKNGDVPGAFNSLRSAIVKAMRQNLIGGQRFQSTSDFRPEWGLDYIMTFIEQQAIGSNGQLYTKVSEAVPMYASAGIDVNCSIMPESNGWHEATDEEIAKLSDAEKKSRLFYLNDEQGNSHAYLLDFSGVTGMAYEAARLLSKAFDNVQMIMVGINDIHIRACLGSDEIDFVIPWHASGNTKGQLQAMMNTVKEKLTSSSDYTKDQTDTIADKEGLKTAHGKLERGEDLTAHESDLIHKEEMRDARMRLLTGQTLTQTDRARIAESKYLTSLYERFMGETLDGEKLKHDKNYWVEIPDADGNITPERLKMTTGQAEQIFPYEYWDTTLTKDDADQNGLRFIEYCNELGLVPRFSGANQKNDDGSVSRFGNFSGAVYDKDGNITGYDPEQMAKGYWKLLIDRKMYDNNGNYRSQNKIDASNVNVGSLMQGEDGQRIHVGSNIPDTTSGTSYRGSESEAKYENADRLLKERLTYKAQQGNKEAAMEAKKDLANIEAWEKAHANIVEQYSMSGEINPAEELTIGEKMQMLRDANVDYQDAVARGDMEAAQEDVDHVAETIFEDSMIRDDEGKLLKVYHGTTEQFNTFDMSKGRANMDIQGAFFSPWEIDAGGYGDNVRAFYLNIKNPASEAEGYRALRMFQGQNEAGKKAREYLISKGYDGVNNGNEEYIAFYPEQIKSADPVTYDDNGNVIPLSERFNTENDDIRYSINDTEESTDLTTGEKLQMLRDAGIGEEQYSISDKGGQQANGEGEIPTITLKTNPQENPKQRQWGLEGAQQSDELSAIAKRYVLNHNQYYPDTNAEQIDRAIEWIRSNKKTDDSDGFYESLQKITSGSFNYRSANGQARMIAVMGMAIARNDTAAQVELANAFNKQGTTLGQALQARKLWRLMTPEGRQATLHKMLEQTQDMLDAKGSKVELKLSDYIYMAAAAATEEGDMQKVQRAAAKELAEQLPANWRDRFRSFRMLSMLGNPRTHIRNIIGNAMFIPAVGLKNKIAAAIELGMKQGNRTKTLAPFLSKEARAFARQDALLMKDELTGEAKYNEGNMVSREQKAFKGLLQAIIDFNGDALEAEDWFFLKGHYRRALGGWMMANGYTAEQLNSNPTLLEQGRSYAIEEAKKATYRDFNKLAQTLNKVSRDGGVAGFIVDAVLPFKKTPANILKRGIEYSPVGLMRSLTSDIYHLQQWRQAQNGELNAVPEKALSPTQFVDRICSGLAGSAVLLIGGLLGSMGIVSCGLDDDDDELEKMQGNQKYSIHLNLLGMDATYTMDWSAPMSMPFFVGAAIQEQLTKNGEFDIEDVINAMGAITEPVFNLSMLDGINTLLKTIQYDDTNTLTQIGAKVASNYVTSYVPSVVGAITRTFFDDTRRKNFVESGKGTGVLGTFRYAREQVENKIPGLSQTNIPVRDIWGNPDTSSFAERLIENFISPGYINNYKNDPVLNEIGRVYDETQDSSIIPEEDPNKSITYKNKKYVLSATEWDTYKMVRGQTALATLTDLINSESYKEADVNTQKQMLKNAWSYADKVGRSAVIPNYDTDDINNVSSESIAKDSRITTYNNEMIKVLDANDYTAYETCMQALLDDGVEESSIKTKIGNTYRDQYKEAYKKRDNNRMADIIDILDNTGFDFDTDKWEQQVDEKLNK